MRPVQTLAILTLVLLAHLSPPPAGAKDEHKILLGEPWKNGKNGDIHDKYSQGKTEISHNLQGLSHR